MLAFFRRALMLPFFRRVDRWVAEEAPVSFLMLCALLVGVLVGGALVFLLRHG
jgi:hypothetical protein